jgi:hypothetical protein
MKFLSTTMKKIVLKNISKESQTIRTLPTGNKDFEVKAGKTAEVEKGLGEQYAKAYPELFRVEGKGELNIEEVVGFIAKVATEEEKEEIRSALSAGGKAKK